MTYIHIYIYMYAAVRVGTRADKSPDKCLGRRKLLYIYIYIYICHGCTNLPEAIPTRTL